MQFAEQVWAWKLGARAGGGVYSLTPLWLLVKIIIEVLCLKKPSVERLTGFWEFQ